VVSIMEEPSGVAEISKRVAALIETGHRETSG
jgi:hypothetical protein